MPSTLSNHASISEIPPQQDGHAIANAVDYGAEADEAAGDVPVTGERKQPDKHSMDYIIRSGIAGGLAGCAAKTAVAPLDRVKILFQTSNPQFAKYTGSWFGLGKAMQDIYTQNGVTGLFRGHSATLLKIYPYAAIKFVAYEQYRAWFISSRSQETWFRRFAAGASAGVTSVFFTYPLEVIRVRLAFETKHRSSSLADICKKIYHEHPLPKIAPATSGSGVVKGVAEAASSTVQAVAPRSGLVNFYRGFSTTMLGMVPYAGMSFLTHDIAGDALRMPLLRKYTTLPQPANAPKDKPAPLRAWAELVAGGIAGPVSQTVSYPLEVIRRRMQVGGAVGDGRRLRIGETAGTIFKENGIRGFFVGLSIGYMKVLPMSAVSFYTYERVKTFFGI
ncbi:Uu.00g017250.m01.CDS01 [Anthostomella pinea]|uniref:Mitochondrial thiamine pyrophosphate carrier 1 n=1 Tax=Anthostomella pinea TaxID=933095 RepID=A0AAI8VYW9_9PEZI|nr:Uu.00g017250.m01.CDS01 [Anthostomella pinea]